MILSHINEIVETTISEYDVNIRLEPVELLGNENIYETELKLYGIIKDFIILKAREDSVGWKNCLSLILQVAQQVDILKQIIIIDKFY